MKGIYLSQDNGGCNRLTEHEYKKLSIEVEETNLINIIKSYFNWRKGDFIKRLKNVGTYEYDRFILFVYTTNPKYRR